MLVARLRHAPVTCIDSFAAASPRTAMARCQRTRFPSADLLTMGSGTGCWDGRKHQADGPIEASGDTRGLSNNSFPSVGYTRFPRRSCAPRRKGFAPCRFLRHRSRQRAAEPPSPCRSAAENSPDLNPFEKVFAKLKMLLRKAASELSQQPSGSALCSIA